jgi:hypothetical protein
MFGEFVANEGGSTLQAEFCAVSVPAQQNTTKSANEGGTVFLMIPIVFSPMPTEFAVKHSTVTWKENHLAISVTGESIPQSTLYCPANSQSLGNL